VESLRDAALMAWVASGTARCDRDDIDIVIWSDADIDENEFDELDSPDAFDAVLEASAATGAAAALP
jgi:hypothetical protein